MLFPVFTFYTVLTYPLTIDESLVMGCMLFRVPFVATESNCEPMF
jgi:hypothetical protein